jgi:hypothetical protein
MNMPLEQSMSFVYPKMYEVHSLGNGSQSGDLVEKSQGDRTLAIVSKDGRSSGHVVMPELVGLTAAHLTSEGAYLMDCGLILFIWVGRAVNPTVIEHLFGLTGMFSFVKTLFLLRFGYSNINNCVSLFEGLEGIDTSQVRLNPGGSDLCDRVNRLVAALRSKREVHTPLIVLQEGGPMEPTFFSYLVEDKQQYFSEGAVTYQDFLHTVKSGNGMGGGMNMPSGTMGGIPPSQRRY